MNRVKKFLGLVWLLMAPALVVFMFWQAVEKIGAAPIAARANTALQWGIILLVFTPICIGFFVFGRFALRGEYDHLPQSSAEL